MLARLRSHLSYANVVSTVCLFLVVAGGSAYAVATITGADVVDESLTGADIRGKGGSAPVDGSLTGADIRGGTLAGGDVADNSLTGSDVLESSLAEVPSASRVRGLSARKLDFRANAQTPPTTILNVGGLTLSAACTATGAGLQLQLAATHAHDGAVILAYTAFLGAPLGLPNSIRNAVVDYDWQEGPLVPKSEGEKQLLFEDTSHIVGQIVYTSPGGGVVTVQYTADHSDKPAGFDCLVSGHALQS